MSPKQPFQHLPLLKKSCFRNPLCRPSHSLTRLNKEFESPGRQELSSWFPGVEVSREQHRLQIFSRPLSISLGLVVASGVLAPKALHAQTIAPPPAPSSIAQTRPSVPRPDVRPPSLQPLPEQTPAPPPSLNDLNIPPPQQPSEGTGSPATIRVKQFVIKGSRVFTQAEIDKVTKDFLNRDLSLIELYQAAEAVTQLYIDRGYITTGAYIPADVVIKDGVVPIRVLEGSVEPEDIRVQFQDDTRHRLNPNFVRKRLAIATQKPLNRQTLLEALQLLKLNPIIQDIQAELAAGPKPGRNILNVTVTEGKTSSASLLLDNGRSPSVGSFRRQLQFQQLNLLGLGDNLFVSFTNTNGSNSGDLSYILPINARNGTIALNFGIGSSRIIEEPFDILDITSNSRYYELSFRQPLWQTPTQELAIGLTYSRQESKATLVDGEIPFPVPGSDFEGRTRINALRFFQEYSNRSERAVFALRSQFSAGLDIFDTTINEQPPDGRFFAWRGQAQYVRLLAPDTLLVARSDLQFANRSLPPLEQFGLGGPFSVRGYRQDAILADNGWFGSVEVRVPIWRIPKINGLLQVVPFFDIGSTWNRGGNNDSDGIPSTLASLGLGLRFQMGDNLSARFDWGQRLINFDGPRETLQEKGLYFALEYRFL